MKIPPEHADSHTMEYLLEGVTAGVVKGAQLAPSEPREEEQFRDSEVLDLGGVD